MAVACCLWRLTVPRIECSERSAASADSMSDLEYAPDARISPASALAIGVPKRGGGSANEAVPSPRIHARHIRLAACTSPDPVDRRGALSDVVGAARTQPSLCRLRRRHALVDFPD